MFTSNLRILILIACPWLLLSSLAKAQIPTGSSQERPVPSLQEYQKQKFKKLKKPLFVSDGTGASQTLGTTAYSQLDVKNLAQALDLQFRQSLAPAKNTAPPCDSKDSLLFIQSLNVGGQLDACADYANRCLEKDSNLQPKLTSIAALCASTQYNNSKAIHFFQVGAELHWPSLTTNAEYKEHLLNWSIFLLNNGSEEKVDDVLKKDTSLDAKERKLLKGVVLRLARSSLGDLKKSEIDSYLQSLILKSTGSYQNLLQAIQIKIKLSDYNYKEALALLFAKAPTLENPLLWYDLAYDTIYYGLDENFRWAREIYDISDKYSNPWRNFPSESNTYDYTEIYSDICKGSLLQGDAAIEFNQIKSQLREGTLAASAALTEVQNFEKTHPAKADVLTMKANLFAISGDPQAAIVNYWEAHKLCRYFNRANWGLTLTKRFFKYQQMPDFEVNLQRITERLKTVTPSEDLKSYIINWNSLDSESQRRITYGAWIWQPYISLLQKNNMRTYIKFAFDLLSETPGLSEMKDQRIGGANYPNDNRLWDDVRGIGGTNVVADLAEVFQTAQGDYNLLGHEMSHQFHQMMESNYLPGATCIESIYQEALKEKNFPDGYSAYNKEEHFAQGVTYYLVPKGAAAHFGLNQSWVEEHNPVQFQFIESIVHSGGQLSNITCNFK